MAAPWSFVASYVGTALWSSFDGDGVPLDRHHDISDLAAEARAGMEADCHAFYDANYRYIHCLDAPLARDVEGPVSDREAAMPAMISGGRAAVTAPDSGMVTGPSPMPAGWTARRAPSAMSTSMSATTVSSIFEGRPTCGARIGGGVSRPG